jgi:hypothetical protein
MSGGLHTQGQAVVRNMRFISSEVEDYKAAAKKNREGARRIVNTTYTFKNIYREISMGRTAKKSSIILHLHSRSISLLCNYKKEDRPSSTRITTTSIQQARTE